MNPLGAILARMRIRTTYFASGGRQIAMESCLPAGRGPHPAVILLHGSNGAASSRTYFHWIMAELSKMGYAALFPYYFERTGDTDLGGGESRDEVIARSFLDWQETVCDAAQAAASLPRVDGQRLALMGISLGTYLALGAAADSVIARCVIGFCGGLPENVGTGFSTMPPVLILHGDGDPIVSVERAYELGQILSEKELPHELAIYPGEGHVFGLKAQVDAANRCRAFLASNL